MQELRSLGLVATAAQAEAGVPEHADLAKLTYLSCVIKEAMRLHTVCLECPASFWLPSLIKLIVTTHQVCPHGYSLH